MIHMEKGTKDLHSCGNTKKNLDKIKKLSYEQDCQKQWTQTHKTILYQLVSREKRLSQVISNLWQTLWANMMSGKREALQKTKRQMSHWQREGQAVMDWSLIDS